VESSLVQAFRTAVLTQELQSCVEGARPLHVAGVVPGLQDLIDLGDVVRALNRGCSSGEVTSFKRGNAYHRDSFFMDYLDQAALVLNGAERFFEPILDICQGLDPVFRYATARLVLESPGSCREVPALVGDSDIVAIQIHGQQKLVLRRCTKGLGVTAPRPQPLLSVLVRAGDVLFVPKGLECVPGALEPGEESGASGPILYALLMVRGIETAWVPSLSGYINDALREGVFSEDADAFFRSAVTKQTRQLISDGAEDGKKQRVELEARLHRCTQELLERLSASGLRRHVAEKLEKLRSEQRDGLKKAQAATTPSMPDEISARSWVRVAEGVRCRCTPGDCFALFKRGDDTLKLPIAVTASHMISALCDGMPHALASLPCEDPVERLCVCQILIFKGCLETQVTDPEG